MIADTEALQLSRQDSYNCRIMPTRHRLQSQRSGSARGLTLIALLLFSAPGNASAQISDSMKATIVDLLENAYTVLGRYEEVLKEHPWLLYWSGAARFHISPRESRRYYEQAFTLFDAGGEGEAKGALLSCCVVTANAGEPTARVNARKEEMTSWARE